MCAGCGAAIPGLTREPALRRYSAAWIRMASGAEPNWQFSLPARTCRSPQSLVPSSFRFDDHAEISRNPPAVLRPHDTAVNPGDGGNGPKPSATTVLVRQ